MPKISGQFARFTAVGLFCTGAYIVLFVGLRTVLSAQLANLVAVLISAMLNTVLNRRVTFGQTGRAELRVHAQGLGLFVLGALATSVALAALHASDPGAPRLTEVAVLLIATGTVTIVRFLVYRHWIFAPRRVRANAD